jgi:NAD(P)-dependent dehydrogenase (short-subunit alcohol dehydrogenase family)
VTGAGSGIGAAIPIAFAKAGAKGIALIGRCEHTLAETNSTIKKNYPQVNVLLPLEMSHPRHLYLRTQHRIHKSSRSGCHPRWWSLVECFKINTLGSLYSTQAFIPHAAANAYILNISSSIIHFPPFPGMSCYATSKLAGTKLFDYVQDENPELHVVKIQPGIIDTDVNRISGMPSLDIGMMTFIPSWNMLTLCLVDLAAYFTVWLASPEAKFLKGKFVYANWDVEELKERSTEIDNSDVLFQALAGVERAGLSKLA